jgi:hypothetical protein
MESQSGCKVKFRDEVHLSVGLETIKQNAEV